MRFSDIHDRFKVSGSSPKVFFRADVQAPGSLFKAEEPIRGLKIPKSDVGKKSFDVGGSEVEHLLGGVRGFAALSPELWARLEAKCLFYRRLPESWFRFAFAIFFCVGVSVGANSRTFRGFLTLGTSSLHMVEVAGSIPAAPISSNMPSPQCLHDGGAFGGTQGDFRGQGEGREVVLC